MTDTLLMPWARNADGHLVQPADVPRGDACNCTCLECNLPVQTCQGPKVRWYFRHKGDPCDPARYGETATHALAKLVLLEPSPLIIPELHAHHPTAPKRIVQQTRTVTLTNLRSEDAEFQKAHGYRPDNIGEYPPGNLLLIELRCHHAVDQPKIDRIRADNLACIEILLNPHLAFEEDPNILRQQVLHLAPRLWLHHPQQAKHEAAYAAEIAASQEQRRKYLETVERERQRRAEQAEAIRRDIEQRQANARAYAAAEQAKIQQLAEAEAKAAQRAQVQRDAQQRSRQAFLQTLREEAADPEAILRWHLPPANWLA